MHPAVTPAHTLHYSLHASIPSVKSLHNISLKICGSQENESACQPASRVVDDNKGNAKVGSIVNLKGSIPLCIINIYYS